VVLGGPPGSLVDIKNSASNLNNNFESSIMANQNFG
jgi:hypothetical protein